MTARHLVPLFASLLLGAAGCTVGDLDGPPSGPSGGDGPDAGPQAGGADAAPNAPDALPPDYALSLAPATANLNLGEQTTFTVTLSSQRYDGPVTLTAAGVPDSWVVSFSPSNEVDLSLDGSAVVAVTVEVPSDAEAADTTLSLSADADPGIRTADAAVSVANQLIVRIGAGTDEGTHDFPSLATVRLGADITILNEDTTPHRIHSDNDAAGFPHQPDEMNQGEGYTFTPNRAGQLDYYCHEHDPGAGVGAFQIIDPQ